MYAQAIRLNARDAEAHQRLAQCYEASNQLEVALREYQEAAHLAPQQPSIHFALGLLAMHLNRLPLAEQAFVQVLTVNPADYRSRFLLAQVYERENRWAEAFRECNYVVGPLSASDPAVLQMLNRLRSRLGR
jgi:cytochrome c-type biogenesis protein CcmH/NrfG